MDSRTYIKCIDCGIEILAAPNRVRCKKCQKKYKRRYNKIYAKERRDLCQQMGICIWCGNKVEAGAWMCPDCQEKYNKRRRRR